MTYKDSFEPEVNNIINLISKNKFKDAFDAVVKVEYKFPSEPLILNIKGACLEGMGLLDEAVKSYNDAISIDPNYSKAHYNLGGVLHEMGKLENAVQSYKNSLDIDSDFSEAHNNLGNLLREMEQPDEAIASFKKAIKIRPDYVEALFSLSMIYQDLGLSDEVIDCLKKVIKIRPKFANAYNNLGIAYKELNNFNEAVKAYKNALKIYPEFAEAHNNLGNAFKDLGKADDAINCYEKAINSKSNYPTYHNNLGILLTELKKFDRANAVFQLSLAINPKYPDTHNNLGNLQKEQYQYENAIDSYKTALSIDPNNFEAQNNLGNALKDIGQIEKAKRAFEISIQINPYSPEAHNNLGNILKDLKKFDDAIHSYKKAIILNPSYVECFNNIGIVYFNQGKFDEAIKSYKKVLALNPNFEETYNNLGIVYFRKNDSKNAIKNYNKAISLNPSFVEAYDNLGTCLKSIGELEDALKSYESAISIDPNLDLLLGSALNTKMNLCLWHEVNDQIDEVKNKIESGKLVIDPFEFMALTDDPKLLRKITEAYAKKNYPRSDILPKIDFYPIHKKIRIGYFSADFRLHPVSTLTAQLYEMHDRDKFEIHAFSLEPDSNDEMSMRIRNGVDFFHDVEDTSDKDIALLSRFLEIDIAIDLGGYTEGARTSIFAMSAAPIQIVYIGYLGTMGSDYYDYLIADKIIIPEENQNNYSEKILYLPSFQVNDSIEPKIDKKLNRKDFGLPEEGFIYCCFNNTFKITPSAFDSWSRILKKVENSVLAIFVNNKSSRNNLIREMQKRGVEANRLIFSKSLPRLEYLARNTVVDLFLDTFPYNAGTTASDSLRMNLPVITLKGDSFANRMGASLLTAIQLPELITNSQEEYESLAIELATNSKKYKKIKNMLTSNLRTSPLFDTREFTLNLESAFTEIYETYHRGDKLDHIHVKDNA